MSDKSITNSSGLFILLTILVFATYQRFDDVTQPFIDEFNWRQASTAMMAQNFFRGNWNIFYPEVSWTGAVPGYQGREFQLITYIAAILYNLTGQSEWVGRSLAALAGVWSVFALFSLMDVTVGRRPALFGAALLSIFPGAGFIDRSFLPDGVMSSLAVTSLWLWARFCQSGGRIFLYSSVIAWSLACLVKLQALTVIGPAIYLFALRSRGLDSGETPNHAEVSASILFGGTLIASYYLWATHLAATYPPHHYAGEGKFIWDTSSISEWIDRKYFLEALWLKLIKFLTPLGLILAITGILCFRRKELLFHWWLLFWAFDFTLEAEHLVGDPYNLSIIHPIAAGLGGIALARISILGQRRAAAIGILISVSLLSAIFLSSRTVRHEMMWGPSVGPALHELGIALKQKANPNDLVVSLGLNPLAIFYSGLKGWVFPPAHTFKSREYNILARDSRRRVEVLRDLEREGATWLVAPSGFDSKVEGLTEQTPILWDYVVHHYDLIYESPAGRIFRYSRRGERP